MAHLAHHFDSPAYARPRRRSRVWAVVRRYQLVELFVMIGIICAAWVGASFGHFYL